MNDFNEVCGSLKSELSALLSDDILMRDIAWSKDNDYSRLLPTDRNSDEYTKLMHADNIVGHVTFFSSRFGDIIYKNNFDSIVIQIYPAEIKILLDSNETITKKGFNPKNILQRLRQMGGISLDADMKSKGALKLTGRVKDTRKEVSYEIESTPNFDGHGGHQIVITKVAETLDKDKIYTKIVTMEEELADKNAKRLEELTSKPRIIEPIEKIRVLFSDEAMVSRIHVTESNDYGAFFPHDICQYNDRKEGDTICQKTSELIDFERPFFMQMIKSDVHRIVFRFSPDKTVIEVAGGSGGVVHFQVEKLNGKNILLRFLHLAGFTTSNRIPFEGTIRIRACEREVHYRLALNAKPDINLLPAMTMEKVSDVLSPYAGVLGAEIKEMCSKFNKPIDCTERVDYRGRIEWIEYYE